MAAVDWEPYVRPEIVVATCVFVAIYIIGKIRRANSKNLPPGPMGLPVLGYLPFLTRSPHLQLQKLASRYGKIFSLYLGSKFAVVINDAEVLKAAFSKPEFNGRPPDNPFSIIPDFESPFFCNGKIWLEHRRYVLQAMRDLGLGKSGMEDLIKVEINSLLEEIKKHDGKQIEVKNMLTPSVSNNVCAVTFGSRYEYNDPRRIFLDDSIEKVTTILGQISVGSFMPWILKLPFIDKFFRYDDLQKVFRDFRSFSSDQIIQHEKTLNVNDIRDLIDGYLIEMKSRRERDSQTTFSENRLFGVTMSFFGAGSETMRTTLDWCLYTMAAYPDVQEKVQAEIRNIIGQERVPTYLDSLEMPFTQSVLMEVQRWQTVLPLNLLRYTLGDTVIEGHSIPKGTTVLGNLWSIHHNEEYWTDPMEFKPGRFLSNDGKTVEKSQYYLPFSYGKRSCPGEIVALIETFLYFTSILQKFDVKLPEDDPVNFQGTLTLTYQMRPHKLIFISRN